MSGGFTPRRPTDWVSLCNLMLKNSLSWGRIVPRVTIGRVTLCIPREGPNVKHAIAAKFVPSSKLILHRQCPILRVRPDGVMTCICHGKRLIKVKCDI